MWQEDMGHIYHRRWEQTYESSVFEYKRSATKGSLRFQAEQPEGTKLTFAVRSAARKSELASQPWRPLKSDAFRLDGSDRFLQYQALFVSDNGDRYPVLDRVEVQLEVY